MSLTSTLQDGNHLTSPKRQKKHSHSGFDFKNNCLFCQLPASIEKEKRKSSLVKKRTIVLVSNTEFKTTLLNQITAHIDIKKYKATLEIISGIDLTVVGARYHEVCRLAFYQLSEKASDKLQRKETNILQLDELVEDPSIIRIRVYFRFRKICKYMLWIYFTIDENVDHQPLELHYYCTCKSGARTLGTCVHVASVLWFLGYARYEQNMRYPSIQLLNETTDAAERMLPENIDHVPELVEN
ncbi:unnamed protein product [Psylliodes chrysocephalus]|uniref:SWIM-type domain-containing protein n=1 Tax=Psylliodes chrysocephalus TaxID=3402493 RepID=A0A9P0GLE5_9CUCU|nr:unnamed protein product [Psylliodes chrysocephala]